MKDKNERMNLLPEDDILRKDSHYIKCIAQYCENCKEDHYNMYNNNLCSTSITEEEAEKQRICMFLSGKKHTSDDNSIYNLIISYLDYEYLYTIAHISIPNGSFWIMLCNMYNNVSLPHILDKAIKNDNTEKSINQLE